jgi:preprotein translocase subunit SecB
LLLIECPRLLFPFARRIIAEVTRDGGHPPLMVDPIDFVSLYQKQKASEAAGQTGQAANPAAGGDGTQNA